MTKAFPWILSPRRFLKPCIPIMNTILSYRLVCEVKITLIIPVILGDSLRADTVSGEHQWVPCCPSFFIVFHNAENGCGLSA